MLSVYLCVYMFMYMKYTYVCTYKYTLLHRYMHTFMHIIIYTQMHACMLHSRFSVSSTVPTLHIAITHLIIIGTVETRVPYAIAMQKSYELLLSCVQCANTTRNPETFLLYLHVI